MHVLADPDSAEVKAALTRRCRLCSAAVGDYCNNGPINANMPLAGRLVHHVRTLP